MAQRRDRRNDGAAPLGQVDAQQVPALEAEVDVGGIEEGPVDSLHRLTAGQGRRHAGTRRAAEIDVEARGLKAFDAVFERG